MKFLLTLDSIVKQLLIDPNPSVIDVLAHPVVFPFVLRDWEAAELLGNFHFNFHITLVILFKLLLFVGCMVGKITSAVLVGFCRLAGSAKVAY